MLKSRKKILLSSIAMLLVALIALGSATFAWYITQTSVTAKNATISASVASGLEIRHYTGSTPLDYQNLAEEDFTAWGRTIDLNTKTDLPPAAIDYNTSLSQVVFADGGVGTSYEVGSLTSGVQEDTDKSSFLIDSFQVASSNTQTPQVYWDIDNIVVPTGVTYMTFAVYKDGQFVNSFTSSTSTGSNKVKVQNSAIVGNQEGDAVNHTQLVNNSYLQQTNISQIGTKASPTTFTIIGFADGFNEKCTSQNAKNDQVKISFTFSTVDLHPQP